MTYRFRRSTISEFDSYPPFTSLHPDAVARRTHLPRLQAAVEAARDALLELQSAEGYWHFELEADCTIPAEYILMMHYMDEIDPALESKIGAYLRAHQGEHGGWPLYHGGHFDLSCSVKAYYALKLAGEDPNSPHMQAARESILAHGGAAQANVFTRITLALFDQIPWRGVPFIPVETMFLPRWFPFHLNKVSYWSRTVMVPLFILCSLKPQAANPRKVSIRELFTIPPEQERDYFPARSPLNRAFLLLDKCGRTLEPLIPRWFRWKAIQRAEHWIIERLNGNDGLGAIFPAMVNAYEALALLGYGTDHPYRVQTRTALENLLVVGEHSAYCQPCLSPIWDTALTCHALQEEGSTRSRAACRSSLDWLKGRQHLDGPGDWREKKPDLEGGGWAFQFNNSHYPDLDDTAAVAWVMHRAGQPQNYGERIRRAANWIRGMQSKNGGFAAFDADNTHFYLNEIPFADHGALLDPPTSDVSARCIALLGRLARPEDRPALQRGLAFLWSEQESDGSWYGRWGTNYIQGTWSVLTALEEAGEDPDQPAIRQAVAWLKERQQEDGGWGESNDTYFDPTLAGGARESTPFQTAWALLALMAAGEADSLEVRRGIAYLVHHQQADGLWARPGFTAPGFPRVFYLQYHGYDAYFPLWALARYRNHLETKSP